MNKKRDTKIKGVLDCNIKQTKLCNYVDTYYFNKIDSLHINPQNTIIKDLTTQDILNIIMNEIIPDGLSNNYIPVIVGFEMYNYTRAIIYELNFLMENEIISKNESSFFCMTFFQDNKPILKFWDIQFLVEKDILFKETNSTDILNAIPIYLQELLHRNEHIKEGMFAYGVLTRASLTRNYARNIIGQLYYVNSHNHKMKLLKANNLLCKQNQPKDYNSYALRKACFIGGYSFVSAKHSNQVIENVINIDANSMHHSHILGHFTPVNFRQTTKKNLMLAAKEILHLNYKHLLDRYERPFMNALHIKIKFSNVRLKENSLFKANYFGLLHREKFKTKYESNMLGKKQLKAEEETKCIGFKFWAHNYKFAFAKLISADKLVCFFNEIELWNFAQVYDFDTFDIEQGEIATKWVRPSDYVSLQTIIFYDMKNSVKHIINTYKKGKKYTKPLPDFMPKVLKSRIFNGVATYEELEFYYVEDIKTRYNCIYGNQAQDVYLPEYKFNKNFNLEIDKKTIMKQKNFQDKIIEKENNLSVLFTYGSRIANWSRLHLIMAMILLQKKDKNIKIISGDTDSIHFTSEDKFILRSLQPLHKAIDKAIDKTTERVYKCFPHITKPVVNLGHFEKDITSKFRIDYANKVYLTQDYNNRIELICSGLRRNENNKFNMQNVLIYMINKYGFKKVADEMFGFNTLIEHQIGETFSYINVPKIYTKNKKPIARTILPVNHCLLDIAKLENIENMHIVNKFIKKDFTKQKLVKIEDNKPVIYVIDVFGEVVKYG